MEALDPNGIYTPALVRHCLRYGLNLEDMGRRVRAAEDRASALRPAKEREQLPPPPILIKRIKVEGRQRFKHGHLCTDIEVVWNGNVLFASLLPNGRVSAWAFGIWGAELSLRMANAIRAHLAKSYPEHYGSLASRTFNTMEYPGTYGGIA